MRYTTLLRRPLTSLFAASTAALCALALPAGGARAEPPADTAPAWSVAPLPPDTQATLADILNYDPVRATAAPPSPLRRRAPASSNSPLDWNRSEKVDGSSALSVKKQLPLEWDAKIGADFALAPQGGYQPLPPVREQNTGAAWANVRLPGATLIDTRLDARVDPAKEQGRLGTTFSHALPLGRDYSVTLQNSYAVTESLGAGPSAPAIAGVGAGGTPAQSAAPTQIWSTDRLVKFNILSTGTTLAAGTTSNTLDNVTRNKISAEQKLFGPLSVTTAVTDVGGANSSKSISAGFKFQW